MESELGIITRRIKDSLASAVACDAQLVQIVLAVLLAEGHLLIEDVPGVGKTTLAKALAHSIDCQVGRVQFTPDLLPSDLTGGSIYRAATSEFEFRPGPIFNNIVIADEINRASPKTQSALLEAMEESLVTVEGVSHRLPRPFLVVATQNPVELEGTYPLPEAQRDRFLARIEIGYPTPQAELDLLDRVPNAVDHLPPVTTASVLAGLIDEVSQIRATEPAKQYVVDLVHATRGHRDVRLGASPRASIHLLRAAKAIAAMDCREYVLPDDIQLVAVPVLAHRLILHAEARLSRVTGQEIVAALVDTIPVRRGNSSDSSNLRRLPNRLIKRASLIFSAAHKELPMKSTTAVVLPNRKTSLKMAARAYWLAGASLALIGFGWRIGSADLIGLGAAGITAILAALVSVSVQINNRVTRLLRTAPQRLICGQSATVTIDVDKRTSDAAQQVQDLSDRSLKATALVPLTSGNRFEYQISPTQTGHWRLGPLQTGCADAFGLFSTTKLVGDETSLIVWPKTCNIPVNGVFLVDSVGYRGLLNAAPDDLTLREYSPGDDLRRIHWPTTARTGVPMIRENGARGLPPIQILVDPGLLDDDATREWALEHGGSVACALLEAGHPVRILGAGLPEFLAEANTGREQVLNQIAEYATLIRADRNYGNNIEPHTAKRGVITYALLSANYHNYQKLSGSGQQFGLVIGTGQAATDMVTKLRAAGWRATAVAGPVPHAQAWSMATGARSLGVHFASTINAGDITAVA